MNDDIPTARRALIAGRLTQGAAVVAAALAVEFNISEDAIRRDLRALAAEGICRRVYGGALPIAPGPSPMSARVDKDQTRKMALARAAVPLVKPTQLIFIDSGSTNLALVPLLPEDFGLTVATNSIDIAAAVIRRADIPLIMIGGVVAPDVGGSVDASAVASVSRLNIDVCFLGLCAASFSQGISAYDHADATFKRAVIDASECSVVLATNDKFSTRASYRVTDVSQIDHWVIEHDAPPEAHFASTEANLSVLRAEMTESPV